MYPKRARNWEIQCNTVLPNQDITHYAWHRHGTRMLKRKDWELGFYLSWHQRSLVSGSGSGYQCSAVFLFDSFGWSESWKFCIVATFTSSIPVHKRILKYLPYFIPYKLWTETFCSLYSGYTYKRVKQKLSLAI